MPIAQQLRGVAGSYDRRDSVFIEQVEETAPDVMSISVARGYQRVDGTEPFGYADEVRNIPRGVRSEFVFVCPDQEVEEPRWADGGSYMTFMRIAQHTDAFRQLVDEAARDNVIGRHRDGTRLDLVGVDPKRELSEPPPGLPPGSHLCQREQRGCCRMPLMISVENSKGVSVACHAPQVVVAQTVGRDLHHDAIGRPGRPVRVRSVACVHGSRG